MREYSLDSNADNIFLINFSELKERFDPIYYTDVLTYLNKSSYEKFKLNALCYSFTSGFGAGGNDQTDEQNGIIQIRPTNLDNDGNLIFNRNIYVPNDNIGSKFIVENNDILFNNTNSQERVGKTAIAEDIGDNIYTFSNHITKFRVRENLVLPKYLFILLNLYQSRKIFYSICTNWNNQSGVGLDLLKKLIIPVPPKNKQQLVVDCYNKAYQAKQHKEQEAKSLLSSIDDYLLSELDIKLPEINNSLNERIFTVKFSDISNERIDPFFNNPSYIKFSEDLKNHSKLSELIISITKGETPLWRGDNYVKEGIPLLQVNNLSNKGIDSNFKLIPTEVHSRMHRSKLFGGEVLYSMAGTIGIAVLNNLQTEANINQAIAKIVVDEEAVNKLYLIEYLNSTLGKIQAKRYLTVSSQPNINFGQIKDIRVILPSKEKQVRIIEHILSIRKTAQQLEQEADDIMENSKSEVERLILGQ
nr:restriction endonuclease subunit S [uncultured Psychrobacter sp.]